MQGSASIPQGLILWSGPPESLATWEDLTELRQRFPRAPAWGQAGSEGRGSVSDAATTPKEDIIERVVERGPATAQRPTRNRQASSRYPAEHWVT